MIVDSKDMITTDLNLAKKILAMKRKSSLGRYKFAKKYFSEFKYKQFKNTLDFALAIEWKIPFVIKTNFIQ